MVKSVVKGICYALLILIGFIIYAVIMQGIFG